MTKLKEKREAVGLTQKIIKRVMPFVMAFTCVVSLCSCKKTEDYIGRTGTIIEKDYDPSFTTLIPNRVGNVTIMTPVFHDESYKFKIEFTEEEVEIFEVTESVFNSYEVGQVFTIDEECSII